jgi:hypothetical protein
MLTFRDKRLNDQTADPSDENLQRMIKSALANAQQSKSNGKTQSCVTHRNEIWTI